MNKTVYYFSCILSVISKTRMLAAQGAGAFPDERSVETGTLLTFNFLECPR